MPEDVLQTNLRWQFEKELITAQFGAIVHPVNA